MTGTKSKAERRVQKGDHQVSQASSASRWTRRHLLNATPRWDNVQMWICIDGREPSSGSHQPHGPSSSTCTYLTLRSCALHMPISIYSVPTSLTKTVGSSVINSCHPLLSTPVGKLQCPRDFCSTLATWP